MYFLNFFWRIKLSLALALFFLLAACQGGINKGTSSHVSTGVATSPPLMSQNRPAPANKTSAPVKNLPQARQPTPHQPAVTRVQVVAANPQQGVPLGDDAQVKVDTIAPAPRKTPTTQAVNNSPSPAAPIPVLTPVREKLQEATNQDKPLGTWLDRYPSLSEDVKEYQEIIARLEQEAKEYRQKVAELQQQVKQQWGSAAAMVSTSAHQYVKYTDAYQSRGTMDFDEGKIVVETVDPANPKQHLKEAIVTTLLTPYDAENPEIYSDKKISYEGPALLAGQVIDHEGKPVVWEWRAQRYADYLVANKIQEVQKNGQTLYRVEIPLVENHTQVRGHKYEHLVRASAERYGISEVLIYSIMETESHFNPYATSHIPAYGLMQVVPSTAGKDVFTRIKKRNDQPTRSYLFNPANNIDTGTAYLSILRDNYLKDIRHPLSKEYAMISGYNGGAGNVLRTFHQDRRQAVQVINQLTPQQVYDRLHLKHPRAEARGYIKKVTEAQQKYRLQASVSFR